MRQSVVCEDKSLMKCSLPPKPDMESVKKVGSVFLKMITLCNGCIRQHKCGEYIYIALGLR